MKEHGTVAVQIHVTSTADDEWPASRSGRFSQGKNPWYLVDEAGWNPEPTWTLWKREKSPSPGGTRTPIPRQEFNTLISVVKDSSNTIAVVLIRFDRNV
jgi:hypothetical protein